MIYTSWLPNDRRNDRNDPRFFHTAQLNPALFLDLACQLLKKLHSFASPRNLQRKRQRKIEARSSR